MPAGSMDALGAFSYLSDNLPEWITQLSNLAAHTAAKHAEYADEFKKHAMVMPCRRKNSSICSIRTAERAHEDQPTPTGAVESTEAPRIPRKRRTDEASIDPDDRHTFVSMRHNLIIHYDGHTQKSLEDMVRNIGTARNNIRRGKMSQLPLQGFRGGAFGRSTRRSQGRLEPSAQETPEDQLLLNIRSARSRGPLGPPNQWATKDSSFDLADKHLEVAHSMCETAAYQFLRSGDCSTQLNCVDEKFKVLLELASKEVQRLQAERDENAEDEDEEEATDVTPAKSNMVEHDKFSTNNEDIEVDDGSESIESLDLATFRANRLRRY
ncbi:hypothetical protein EYZ11_012945 [Aspergillus tanneri]|uniref:Uncharacterized protein n=1 Tax=Aspergillus tanneri TaxID=1220188 RepID=A0A4S3J132_9EURO|nr:uncharacterized protein ATNIH1004_001344 [Aspergillus tanneri]KAA8652440.1 hypothetical protein ATNIH1004_001344 [Aspergillus tanneri]THC87608.1 hypothetical protein EYZ11_012945 [Aspergillus tanneri]